MRAAVEVSFADPPPADLTPPWEEIRAARSRATASLPGRSSSEFVYDSPPVPAVDILKAYGATSFTSGRPILAAARELTSRIRADFEYHPGATDISTPLAEVFAGRAGVCQDFAHVEIAALRAHGLAARRPGHIRTALREEDRSCAAPTRATPGSRVVRRAGGLGAARSDQRPRSQGRPCRRRLGPRLLRRERRCSGVILGGESHSYGVAVTLVPTAGSQLGQPPKKFLRPLRVVARRASRVSSVRRRPRLQRLTAACRRERFQRVVNRLDRCGKRLMALQRDAHAARTEIGKVGEFGRSSAQ